MNDNTNVIEKKVCAKCKLSKPKTTEFFGRFKRTKDGFRWECKECRKIETERNKVDKKEYDKKYRADNRESYYEKQKIKYNKNKESYAEQSKEYRLKNLTEIKKKKKEYYFNNKEKINEKNKLYYINNKEKVMLQVSRYYQANKDIIKELNKKWCRENPEQVRELSRRGKIKRRLFEKNVEINFSINDWEKCKREFNNECAYCGCDGSLEREHFVPLSKGGEYTKNNIVTACRSCNSSKGTKSFFLWYPKHESYSKQRERKILKYLNYNENNVQQLALI